MNRLDIKNQLGAKIAYLRKHKRFSQERLAEKSDISAIYIGEIERGDAILHLISSRQSQMPWMWSFVNFLIFRFKQKFILATIILSLSDIRF